MLAIYGDRGTGKTVALYEKAIAEALSNPNTLIFVVSITDTYTFDSLDEKMHLKTLEINNLYKISLKKLHSISRTVARGKAIFYLDDIFAVLNRPQTIRSHLSELLHYLIINFDVRFTIDRLDCELFDLPQFINQYMPESSIETIIDQLSINICVRANWNTFSTHNLGLAFRKVCLSLDI